MPKKSWTPAVARVTLVASLVATAFTAPSVRAADAAEHTLTGNVGLYSQYVFRGLRQTDKDPALQGGFDYSHSSGFYVGTWATNISWLRDFNAYKSGGSLEWDFYGGYKGTFGQSDFGYDVGLLYYWYPGNAASGGIKANTLEAYGALSWKWLTAKYSYSLDDKTFGVRDSDGTWYLDLSANVPVTEQLALQAHWGRQRFKGSTGGVSNHSVASYKDWRLGATYALPQNFTVGAYYTDTDMNSRRKAFYTDANGHFIGKESFVVFLQKTF